jgi:ribosomal protein S18 acetylase RimI-like enzyme
MDLWVRLADGGDVEAIFAIRTSVRENHLSREQLAAMGIVPEGIAREIEAEPCAWVCEADGAAVGSAMVRVDEACLYAVFVRPEFEGLGVGRALMVEAEKALFARHAVIWLETDSRSRAFGFYVRLGWRVVAEPEGGDVRMEKRRVGGLLMGEKQIP